jgi:hypothetical protein
MKDTKDARGTQSVRKDPPPAVASVPAGLWTYMAFAFAAIGIVGLFGRFSLGRNPVTIRPALELPAPEEEIPGDVHTYNVLGDT